MAAVVKQYAATALSAATNSFDRQRFLGSGTFGQVYAGVLDGKQVAIKRMGTAHRTQEMQRERMRDAKLRHDCLLPCLGMVRARSPTVLERASRVRHALAPKPQRCSALQWTSPTPSRLNCRAPCAAGAAAHAFSGAAVSSPAPPPPPGASQADDSFYSYIVYPRMRCDLDQALRPTTSSPALTAEQLLQIALDCASGLKALEAFNLCHRDLKPPNVLLNHANRAVLADFGTLCLIPECVAQRTPAMLHCADSRFARAATRRMWRRQALRARRAFATRRTSRATSTALRMTSIA